MRWAQNRLSGLSAAQGKGHKRVNKGRETAHHGAWQQAAAWFKPRAPRSMFVYMSRYTVGRKKAAAHNFRRLQGRVSRPSSVYQRKRDYRHIRFRSEASGRPTAAYAAGGNISIPPPSVRHERCRGICVGRKGPTCCSNNLPKLLQHAYQCLGSGAG